MSPDRARLESAQREVVQARQRFQSTLGALQYRLKPGTIAHNAWDGVREKSGALADEAMTAVKERPGTVSGVVAGIALFLAREPLWRFATGLFAGRGDEPPGTIHADLDHDPDYDLTAPRVKRSQYEGVNA